MNFDSFMAFFQQLNALDWFALVIIVLMLLDGWLNGVKTLLNLFAMIAAGIFAKFWAPVMLSFLNNFVGLEQGIRDYIVSILPTNPDAYGTLAKFVGAVPNVPATDLAHKIALLVSVAASFILMYLILRIFLVFLGRGAEQMLFLRFLGVLIHLVMGVLVVVLLYDVLWMFAYKSDTLRNLFATSKVWPLVSYVNAYLLTWFYNR